MTMFARPLILMAALFVPSAALAQSQERPGAFPAVPPLSQSTLAGSGPGTEPVTLRDAARPDRWLGAEVRDVRWAPDGSGVFFRWHPDAHADQDPDRDPWLHVDPEGEEVRQVPPTETHRIPAAAPSWSDDGARATWIREGHLYLYDANRPREGAGAEEIGGLRSVHAIYRGPRPASDARMGADGSHVDFTMGEDLFRYQVEEGSVRQLTRRHEVDAEQPGGFAEWLREEELRLFRQHREDMDREDALEAHRRALDPEAPQVIPAEPGVRISHLQLAPDGRHVTFRWTRPADRDGVRYADYASRSGYTEIHDARPKAGEPRDEYRMGVVRVDPDRHPDSVEVRWVELDEAENRATIVHGPWWDADGGRALVQVMSRDHKDLWIAELDPAAGTTRMLVHDHDPAWLGGPPPQGGSLQPTLLEWLDGDRFVFASERTGWSHLHLAEIEGEEGEARVRPLTEGEWEVRGAELSPDGDFWLLTASREHPSDDHLYGLPARGGELVRLTDGEGRFSARLAPAADRLAVIHSDAVSLPDLYLRGLTPGETAVEGGAGATRSTEGGEGRSSGLDGSFGGADDMAPLGVEEMRRITVSGSDHFHRLALVRPEMVSFEHPDGDPVWAALFLPPEPNAERAAVMHIHGGGYRQFAHRGWSVYGWAAHVGFINHLLEQGYAVLDFDYRGSAGFGRDYRTDIYRAMGHSDVDGAVAGVEWLAREHGVDPDRVGMYGLSYGGFFTLMALFRHPGVFAAGVSDDGVTDWAHYSDGWTTRILNRPQDDPEAYRQSSPIHHAEGLEDPLLISHGLIDDNVHFQDAVRLVQRLVELEKDFEVMYYPLERHGFRTEGSRYDYYRRVDAHFRRHLLER